jgi:hypothetical protein
MVRSDGRGTFGLSLADSVVRLQTMRPQLIFPDPFKGSFRAEKADVLL